MNASEQAKSLEITSKIATIVNLFKLEFPDAKADLKPWRNDPKIIDLIDPNSIDIGFHFPGWSPKIQSRSILVQIRLHQDCVDEKQRLIGIETAGFNHNGEAWKLSTIDNWQFIGQTQPHLDIRQRLKNFCVNVFEIFLS